MAFRSLFDRFYRRKTDGYRAMLIGLGGAGKTTMLYKLVLGEVITTSPSIGFNIETIRAPTTSGRDLTMTIWDVGMGCGIQNLVWMVLPYAACADAIIWVMDSSDTCSDTLDESVQMLGRLVRALAHDSSGTENKNMPILILANKQDKPGAVTPLQVYNRIAPVCGRHIFTVFPTSTTQEVSMGGLPEAFNWLLHALENPVSEAVPDSIAPTAGQPELSKNLDIVSDLSVTSDKLSSWISRTETDFIPEDFLAKFESIDLPAWDHYTHIRIAYTLLTTHGRQKGKNMIFDGIERYIGKSNQTRGRAFHITMTYFWIQLVHYGIRSMPPMYVSSATPNPADSSATLVEIPQKSDVVSPSLADFRAFLVFNPHVMDGNLWAQYYSKNVMMSPAAKSGLVLPDKKPLPNLVVRDVVGNNSRVQQGLNKAH